MCCLKLILFVCVLCTKYLMGDLDTETLKTLIESAQIGFDDQHEPLDSERSHNALKRQAVVNLPKYGILQGSIGLSAWSNRNFFQFLDVPYAESPSGLKRFKAPTPIKPWNGVRNAENFGTKCPTWGDINKMTQSEREKGDLEDCLNMAIYTTNMNASYPVMVYIHGGGYYLHNAEEFPPNYLMERDIVLIVVQYRLDILGFLSTNSKDIPGNAGLMDSILALKFVKENVQYFGGDPNKLTVFGQSSGAAMVSALIISPTVPEDLFQAAIVQSGSILADWAYTSDPVTDARNIAQAAGLNPNQTLTSLNRAFMTMNVYDLLKAVDKHHMSALRERKVLKAGRSIAIGGPNNLLPDTPRNIMQSGSYNKTIPIIVGTTKDDGSYVTSVVYDILDANDKLRDKNFMQKDLIYLLCQMSGINDPTGSFEGLAALTFWTSDQLSSGDFGKCATGITDMMSTSIFKAPALKVAQMNAKINPLGTYLYTIDYKGQHTRFGYGENVSRYPFLGGVHHSDDLMYLFPYPPNVATLNEEDTKFSKILVDLWTSFAISGVPELPLNNDGINELTWQPFSGPFGPYLHIDKKLQTADDFRKEFIVHSPYSDEQIL